MNIRALLLCFLSTAIAIPFYSDYQLDDSNPLTNLPVGDPVYEAGIPNPVDLNSNPNINPGSAGPFHQDIPYTSLDGQSRQNKADNPPPVMGSTAGQDVCCGPKRGEEKQVCQKLVTGICYPGDLYNCPQDYKEDLNGCTKLRMDARREPSWPNPADFWYLGAICLKKPKPPLCPGFFDNFGGFGSP